MNTAIHAIDILGATAIGDAVEEDAKAIGVRAREMSAIRNVTVAIAGRLLKGGLDAMAEADRVGTSDRVARRENITGHLRWHRDRLAQMAGTPNEPYPHASDLRTWTIESFIEANVSKHGRAYADRLWAEMIAEIKQNALAFYEDPMKYTTGIPSWLWWVGGAATVGLLGFGAYKILLAAAPSVAPIVAGRYLPGGK